MFDPIILGLGVAAHFMGRTYGWAGQAAFVVVSAVALFVVMVLIAGPLPGNTLFAYLVGIALWAIVIQVGAMIVGAYRGAIPSSPPTKAAE